MPIRASQKLLLQTNLARDKAEVLRQGLMQVRHQTHRHATRSINVDAAQAAAGQKAMHQAIGAAEQLVERLNRVMAMAEEEISGEMAEIFDEAVEEI